MKKTLTLAAALLALAQPALAADDVSALWKKQCSSCHGMDGKGDTEMGAKIKKAGGDLPDMSSAAWHKEAEHTDKWMKDVISNGVQKDGKQTKMKAYKEKLSPEQIDSLVGYIHGLGPK